MNLSAPRRIITRGATAPSARYSPIASSWPRRPARWGPRERPSIEGAEARASPPERSTSVGRRSRRETLAPTRPRRDPAGAGDDERDAARALEEAHLVPESALAEHFAVIAHDDDDRILREAARAKRLHESTEVVVDIGDRAQIGAARVAHLSLGDRLRVHRADVAQAARVGIERLGGARGHGDVLVEIEVPIALRHGERIVRVGERSHEQEGPPVIQASNVEDRPLRSEGDLVVEVELVG